MDRNKRARSYLIPYYTRDVDPLVRVLLKKDNPQDEIIRFMGSYSNEQLQNLLFNNHFVMNNFNEDLFDQLVINQHDDVLEYLLQERLIKIPPKCYEPNHRYGDKLSIFNYAVCLNMTFSNSTEIKKFIANARIVTILLRAGFHVTSRSYLEELRGKDRFLLSKYFNIYDMIAPTRRKSLHVEIPKKSVLTKMLMEKCTSGYAGSMTSELMEEFLALQRRFTSSAYIPSKYKPLYEKPSSLVLSPSSSLVLFASSPATKAALPAKKESPDIECPICFDPRKDILALPCGHIVCSVCEPILLNACALCRKTYKTTIRLSF